MAPGPRHRRRVGERATGEEVQNTFCILTVWQHMLHVVSGLFFVLFFLINVFIYVQARRVF